jgi:putative tricarboxylic transport membrane protein
MPEAPKSAPFLGAGKVSEHYASSVICKSLRAIVACCLLALSLVSPAMARAGQRRMERLTLVVPAAAGGGWDLTAKAMRTALEREELVGQVTIVRYPGAGGLIGLSQFVARHRGQDDVLLVGGLVMLGAALRDEAAITLHDVTPIARLTGEWDILVAPSQSPFHSIGELRETMARDPAALRWVGGALGGPDQGLVWTIADQVHAPLDEVAYYGRAGGRRVTDALLQGRGDIGVSGYAEFAPRIESGELRVLGVAAPARVVGIDAPTLREGGLDVTMMNWRAVFAAPGISAAQQDRLTALMAAMAKSGAWASQLRENRWTGTYLDGNPLSQFLDREQTRWADVVNPPKRAGELSIARPGFALGRERIAGLALAIMALVGFVGSLVWRLRRRRSAGLELERRCRDLALKLQESAAAAGKLIKDGIDGDFGEWRLSDAECDIAWFMLRGLPMREIATLRGTSERTVRQQAQSIYRKAGLEGRSDLAGRVLERFI